MKGRAGVVDGFHSFVVLGVPALGSLAVTSLEENVALLVDACVIEKKSCNAADVLADVDEETQFEHAWAGGVKGLQIENS